MKPQQRIDTRLNKLQEHLERENPMLVKVVDEYRSLDSIARKMGLLNADESYATQISWWPMVAVLGTFSAGKSSFVNSYVGTPLQRTGNQAVDDRFTVVTFARDGKMKTLPGLALDGDPRFPFYQISEELEKVAPGEGARVDDYLQLKVTPSESLKGKILIDSPGFDADEQRKSTLRITDHIIEISDLVLVLFDARHPEPGAMQDTLEHLVKGASKRNDSSKFVYILNQIDTSAKEDNLEQIVASWQKALVQKGLTSGNFLTLFNKDIAVPVENEAVWNRYVEKCDKDHAELMARMDGIETERAYRIIGTMESLANQIEHQTIPRLQRAMAIWKKHVLITDAVIFSLLAAVVFFLSTSIGSLLQSLTGSLEAMAATAIGVFLLIFGIHHRVKQAHAKRIVTTLDKDSSGDLQRAFMKSCGTLRSVFAENPVGWGGKSKRLLETIRLKTDAFVQGLNDGFAQTSSKSD